MKKLLKGLRILDLTRLLPGPLCTLFLADMGAEIVKVEDPRGGDFSRQVRRGADGHSHLFSLLNRNKKSLTLNLQDPTGRDIFLKLVPKFDVIIEGFRPGVMDKLGIGYRSVKKFNSKIVYCSLTGYGQTGPYRDHPGHDLNYLGYSGVLAQFRRGENAPSFPNFQIADIAGGTMMAALSIVSAVHSRHMTGKGTYLDVSMLDGTVSLSAIALADHLMGHDQGLLNGGSPCYDVYRTKDNKFMALAAIEPKFWTNFVGLIKRPDLANYHLATGSRALRLRAELTKLFCSKSQKHWTTLFSTKETCCTPILSTADSLNNSQIVSRGFIQKSHLMFPVFVDGRSASAVAKAPRLGEQTISILKKLGIKTSQISKLKKEQII